MTTTPRQLASVIRYHLGEMRAQNAHHDFEHLARHLTHLRVYSNLLPATGPVSSGGDQARDFETYRTDIEWPVTFGATFWQTSSKGRNVAVACSLERKIERKIRADIRSILLAGPVDEVVYFCEANVSISGRHKLQKWATEQGTSLQIFDGTAIAEMLSDRDTFWIAQEFLGLPAELKPQRSDDADWYAELKTRWRERQPLPFSQSDFIEIKSALRHARFHIESRSDLLMWMKRMEGFLAEETPRPLRRHASYEILVASLRGKGEMANEKHHLVDYYSDVQDFVSLADLQDAATLLLYAFSAWRLGALSKDVDQIFAWRDRIVDLVDRHIDLAPGPSRRAGVLRVRGYLSLIPRNAYERLNRDEAFGYWGRMLDEAAKAPLFPLESFADVLTSAIEQVGDDTAFLALAARVDDLMAHRAGSTTAGEKALERALALLDQNHILSAIRQLHRVKSAWFSGERVPGFVRSLIILSESYRCLGLAYAAKYYALAAAHVATHEQKDEVVRQLPDALLEAVDAEGAAGNSFGMIQLLLIAIAAHVRLDQDPLDLLKHPRLHTNLGQVAAMLGFLQRGQSELKPNIARALALWPEPLRDGVLHAASDPEGFWNQGTWAEAWNCVEEAVIDRPFGDLGPRRSVSWRGLGIRWIARFSNTYVDTPSAEQFIAELQCALCCLTQEDLALVPTQVTFDIDVSRRKAVKLMHVPSPGGGLNFSLSLPRYSNAPADSKYVLSAIATVFRICSLLPEKQFRAVFEHAMPALPEEIFVGRPYSELYREFLPRQLFLQQIRHSSAPVQDGMPFTVKEVSELAWTDGLGPTYSEREALESVRLRYTKLINCVGVTARRLAQDTSTRGILIGMHNCITEA